MNKITTFWIGHSSSLGNNTFKLKTFISAKDTAEQRDNWKNIHTCSLPIWQGADIQKTKRIKTIKY